MKLVLDSEVLAGILDFEEIYDLSKMGYGVSTPEPRTNMVEIPGRNGLLDLTGSLGPVTYGQRSVWFAAMMVDTPRRLTQRYSEILNKYHGQRCKLVLDDEPDYYYDGRCAVSREYIDNGAQAIRIDLDADPLKYPVYASDEDWLWDPFNFETGVIRNYSNIVISGTRTVGIIGYEQPESPKFYVTLNSGQSSMRMVFAGNTYYLHNGMNSFPQIVISSQDVHTDINQFTFTGYGKVSVDMRGGIL